MDTAEVIEERVTAKHLRDGDEIKLKGELRTIARIERDRDGVTVVTTDGTEGWGGHAGKWTRRVSK